MSLFPQKDKSRFLNVTGTCYDNMKARLVKKGLPSLPFTKDQFRAHILDTQMGGFNYDEPIRCRYCGGLFALEDCQGDHMIPLSRGGDPGLKNIELICADDNAGKGEMKPLEYEQLLHLIRNDPGMYNDVFNRLKTWGKLVSRARRAEMRAREGGTPTPARCPSCGVDLSEVTVATRRPPSPFSKKRKGLPPKPPIMRAIDENF